MRLGSAGSELRRALRSLIKNPGHTLTASAILALGLGLAMFMFSGVNSYILRPLPFPEPERLLHLELTRILDNRDDEVQLHDFLDYRREQRSLESLAAFYHGTVNVGGGSHPERLDGAYITASTFEVLRAQPFLGRGFLKSENQPGAQPVVILGHELWRDRYGSDGRILGETIRVNGREAVVVGVMPPGFEFPVREVIWVPISLDTANLQRGEGFGFEVMGRLKPGATLEQARTEFREIAARLGELYPETNAGFTTVLRPFAHEYVEEEARSMILTMFAAALLVLLVACANVANLVLARNAARSRELAVRTALGASRWRLVLHVLAECLVISALGGVVGFWLARWGGEVTEAVFERAGDFAPPYWITFEIDWRSVAFATGAAFAAAALAGIVPALRASRTDVNDVLHWGGRGASASPLGRLTRGFVVLQVAFSCVVLISAGLMARSVIALQHTDIGAETDGILTGRIGLFETDYQEEGDCIRFFERLVERLSVLPGVRWATASTSLPGAFSHGNWFLPEGLEPATGGEHPTADEVTVAPNYFDAFGIPVREGRGVLDSDAADGLPVAVVNEMLARRYWPGESALGRRIRMGLREEEEPWRTIVGLVPNVVQDEVGEPVRPTVYLPLAQHSVRFISLAVRAEGGNPKALAEPVRKAVLELDKDLPVYWVRTLEEWIDLGRFGARFIAAIFSLAALGGILLGAVGQYAVLAYTVSQRTREIGVRRALGALDRDVMSLLLREGVWQLGVGLSIGVVLSLGFVRLLANALTGVGTYDPTTFGAVPLALMIAAVVASVIPALRALRVEPAVALRCE
jgi:predicted permease